MIKITCEVVKDLLPLYVDDVLSYDSRIIVEEHLKTCEECVTLYTDLKGNDSFIQEESRQDKAAIKKIKRKIHTKRIVTAFISALCIAVVAFGVFYGIVIKESYIPYDESGLSVAGDSLQTNRDFYKNYGMYTPDGKTCFIYMTTTVYTSMKSQDRVTVIEDLSDEGRRMEIMDEDGLTNSVLMNSEIYYVSEEYSRQMSSGQLRNLTEEEIAKLKENSVLVWSAE